VQQLLHVGLASTRTRSYCGFGHVLLPSRSPGAWVFAGVRVRSCEPL
jgi:hypothetical protein